MISKEFSERLDNSHLQKIIQDCERQQVLLESGKRELDKLREDSKKHIAQCASIREKLSAENKSTKSGSHLVIRQTMKQKDDDTLVKLAEKQKLEAAEGLELELETLKSFEAEQKVLHVKREEFQRRKEEIEALESLADALFVNEQRDKNHLHEARQALIDGLKEHSSSTIGTKKIGELDPFPFLEACKRKYPGEISDIKAVELCSLWEANLQDPAWRPFTTILSDGVRKEVINTEDERLRKLKDEWGEDVYVAVLSAMREINEYNPSERLPVTELWNYKLDRRATLREGAEFIVEKWKNNKRRKRTMV